MGGVALLGGDHPKKDLALMGTTFVKKLSKLKKCDKENASKLKLHLN